MIFLIQYNRPAGKLQEIRQFHESDRSHAQDIRLQLELQYNREHRLDMEVILLEAASEADLRRTHRRYFEDLGQIVKSAFAT